MSQLELVPDDELAAIPEVGTLLDGKYRIDGLLGQGGMAVVLAATHLQLEQRVAIKLLLPACAQDPEAVARFLLEGRAASKIRSEHVCRVIDVGMDEARPYLVMEYLAGTDFQGLITRDGPLSSVLAVDYLLQACEAIAEAHVSGVVHRDLKPANLFLTHRADGTACVKVLDFGISKILRSRNSGIAAHETSPNLLMGSPHYMSPEQMKSAGSVDQRSDLWSLGAILHEFVAGKPPFDGETITALCAAILTEDPPRLSSPQGELPRALEAVVQRCLAKDPAQRFKNVAELAAALSPLGTDAARNSALCIARVLDGGLDAAREPPRAPPPSFAPAALAATSFESRPSIESRLSIEGARRPRTHVGRLAAFVAFLLACTGIAWFFVRADAPAPDPGSVTQAATAVALPTPVVLPPASVSVPNASSAAPVTSVHRAPAVPAVTSNPLLPAPRANVDPTPERAVAPDPAPAPTASDEDASADNPY